MRLRLPIGIKIAAPPLFYWERRRPDLLRLQSARSFHPYHATTLLCLELLEETLLHHQCHRLLDVGCGSGIFALTAAYMGIKTVVGIDLSSRAIRESRGNAELNHLTEMTSWVVGPPDAIRGSFDCVIANLREEILMNVMEDLVRLTSMDGGRLILSGFHDIGWPVLEARCHALGMKSERALWRDLSFCGIPPSGSYTWCAVRLHFDR
jgi:ribosomal protein L11 methylase PrmA